MPDLAMFDLDGTLVDTRNDIVDAMNVTLSAFGFAQKDKSCFRTLIGNGSRHMVESLVPINIAPQAYEYFLKQYDSQLTDKTRPYPEVEQTLQVLVANGSRIAVVTNKYHAQAEVILQRLFPNIRFDAIQGYLRGEPRKPDPASALKVLEQLGISADNSLFIGDTQIDIETASSAGMKSVFVTWGYGDINDLIEYKADYTIDRMSNLLTLTSNSD